VRLQPFTLSPRNSNRSRMSQTVLLQPEDEYIIRTDGRSDGCTKVSVIWTRVTPYYGVDTCNLERKMYTRFIQEAINPGLMDT
jgi:hypothetical protein